MDVFEGMRYPSWEDRWWLAVALLLADHVNFHSSKWIGQPLSITGVLLTASVAHMNEPVNPLCTSRGGSVAFINKKAAKSKADTQLCTCTYQTKQKIPRATGLTIDKKNLKKKQT